MKMSFFLTRNISFKNEINFFLIYFFLTKKQGLEKLKIISVEKQLDLTKAIRVRKIYEKKKNEIYFLVITSQNYSKHFEYIIFAILFYYKKCDTHVI